MCVCGFKVKYLARLPQQIKQSTDRSITGIHTGIIYCKVLPADHFCICISLHYATIGGIYFSACRVSRGLLGGIEWAYLGL